jgi:hypothetical protein
MKQSVILPKESDYVVAKGPHLYKNNKPVRFWGAIGGFPGKRETVKGDPYFRQREAVRRAKKVGFNLFRLWSIETDTKAKKGDLSETDVSDFFIAECGKQGMSLWGAGFGGGALYLDDVKASAKMAGEPSTEDEWVKSVEPLCKPEWWSRGRKAFSLLLPAVAWDERLEAIAIAQMQQKAQHINIHTGLRHADDPTFAIWELTNEQWWMSRMMGGQWQDLPLIFRKSLQARWTAFLQKKYGTEAGLKTAWGFLFPGEILDGGSVLIAPLAEPRTAIELNDTNPAARAAFETIKTPISRDSCTPARASDVIAFFLEIIVAHKQRWGAALKTWGKSCKLCPLLYDTGIGQSIQAQYLHSLADATAHASYMEGLQIEKLPRNHRRFPFYSRLDQFPQLSNDVPWLEHNRPVDKPFFCYETQFGSPSKYRAEWPGLIATLGSIQEWDAACYHFWSIDQYDFAKTTPYGGALAKPGDGAYQYDYTSDALEQATMRVAGAVFTNHLLAPAPKPTVFTWGKPALFDPQSMDYGRDYGTNGLMDMMATAYTNGSRIAIDPNQKEFLKTSGPVTRFNGYERSSRLRPSRHIEYDTNKSHVMLDAPGVASYTGFFAQYGSEIIKFSNGVTVTNITHNNPPNTPYPTEKSERFFSFTLASEDGKPLDRCQRAVLALVASSFNTDLKLTPKPDGSWDINWGKEPVLVTRVGAVITARVLMGMRYQMIDFNENILEKGVIGSDGKLIIPSDKPIWLIEFSRG